MATEHEIRRRVESFDLIVYECICGALATFDRRKGDHDWPTLMIAHDLQPRRVETSR